MGDAGKAIQLCLIAVSLLFIGCKFSSKEKIIKLTLKIGADSVDTSREDEAIRHTYHVLQNRLNKIAGDNARCELDAGSGIVRMEFSSARSLKRVCDYLTATGDIQFYETYSNEEFYPLLATANDKLAFALYGYTKPTVQEKGMFDDDSFDVKTPLENMKPEGHRQILKNGDTGSLQQYTSGKSAHEKGPLSETQVKYPLFGIMSPMTTYENGPQKGAAVGFVDTGEIRRLESYLANKALAMLFPPSIRFVYGPVLSDSRHVFVYVIKLPADAADAINGSCINNTKSKPDELTGKPAVHIKMNAVGAGKWAKMTRNCKGRYIAVVYDGIVISSPRVADEITTGYTEISGTFTEEEATDLAYTLNSGKLPLPVHIVDSTMGK